MADYPDVDLTELPKTLEAEVPENYMDVMGHMNVGWYSHFFSEAMLGLYTQLGFGVDDINDRQMGRFALETHIRYLREVRVGHKVEVFSRFIARNEKRFHVINFLWNKTLEGISATYEVVGTSVDLRLRNPAPFPSELMVKMDKMISAHKQLDWDPPLCGVMGPR